MPPANDFEHFDPYHEWLGIAPKDQPPNHYRLLGVDLFEANPSTIEHAANRQMAHLRTFQAGKHGALSQKILNEVAAAKICLLSREKKVAYDQHLRETLQPDGAMDLGLVEALQQARTKNETAPPKPRRNLGVLIGIGCAVVAGLGVLGLIAVFALLTVTIRIQRPVGNETLVTVPNGSNVAVDVKGDVEATPRAKAAAAVRPEPKNEPGKPSVGKTVVQPPKENVTTKPAAEPAKPPGPEAKSTGAKPGTVASRAATAVPTPSPQAQTPAAPKSAAPAPPTVPKPKLPAAETSSKTEIVTRPAEVAHVRGRSLPPPAAIAPFGAAQAKRHQEAWASHLEAPVEETNSIGMEFGC